MGFLQVAHEPLALGQPFGGDVDDFHVPDAFREGVVNGVAHFRAVARVYRDGFDVQLLQMPQLVRYQGYQRGYYDRYACEYNLEYLKIVVYSVSLILFI